MTTRHEMPQRKSGVRSREVGDELLLFDPDRQSIHVLNATAGLVWELADGRHSPVEIGARLAECYEVPEDTHPDLEADVAGILSTLSELGLFESAAGAPAGEPADAREDPRPRSDENFARSALPAAGSPPFGWE